MPDFKKFGQGVDIAKRSGKGAPRDAGFRDVEPHKGAQPRCYETNPAKGGDVGRGTEQIKGKLGS